MIHRNDKGMTVYDTNPNLWDEFASSGFPALREASKRFYRPADMARGLNISPTAISYWRNRKHHPNIAAENAAAAYLKRTDKPYSVADVGHPVTPEAAQDSPRGQLFLVKSDADMVPKMKTMLAMLGCEVMEF